MRKIFLVLLVSLMFCSCSSQYKSHPTTPPLVTKSQNIYFENVKCPKNSIKIASFNIQDLGQSKSDQELSFIAELISEFDIVGVQEVVAGKGGKEAVVRLDAMLDSLGENWNYIISPATQGTGTEKFAFFWKEQKFSVHKATSGLFENFQNDMVRPPYKGVFVNGNVQLDLYSFHLAPTSKNPLGELEFVGENNEFFQGENVIFMGDFNLSRDELDSVLPVKLELTGNIRGQTSLKRDNVDGVYLSKEYDNIYTSPNITVLKAGIIDFVPEFEDFKEAKGISDHLPVFACLRI